MRPERFDAVAVPAVCAAAGLLSLWRLDSLPPPWWDEGWTLAVARHWVERGHYGRLFLGEPAAATLAAGVTVTAPVAAAFGLVGVGFWQGRIFGVVCLVVSSLLLFALARRLFDRATAWAGLGLAVLASPMPAASTLSLARQVLGEMPMLAYLLGGFLCLHSALRAAAWWMLPSAVLLAAAVLAKAQLQVFLGAAMAAAVLHAWIRADRRGAIVVAATATLALAAAAAIDALRPLFLPGFAREAFDVVRLYFGSVIVVDAAERVRAARLLVLYGLPSLIGLGFALRDLRPDRRRDLDGAVRSAWLFLALAWLGWFVFLAAAWPRYLFPAVYLASPFVAHFVVSSWREGKPFRRGLAAGVLLVAVSLGVRSLALVAARPGDGSVAEVAAWLNTRTPPDAVVESYESELLFLLQRPYRHPPVDVHVRMIELFRGRTPGDVGYRVDPADADYLVVGPFADTVVLYRPEDWGFHQTQKFGPYRVFEPDSPAYSR